jgi:hypothetical protein
LLAATDHLADAEHWLLRAVKADKHSFAARYLLSDVAVLLRLETQELELHHFIQSHHGILEHGAAVRPMTLEAELLQQHRALLGADGGRVAVLDDAARKDAVIRFITFMTSANVQKFWLDQFKRLPSNAEVAKDPSIASDPILAGSMAALSNGRGQPAAAEMRCAWDAWRPNLEGVMAGTTTPADAAVAAQTSADECVATLGQPTAVP